MRRAVLAAALVLALLLAGGAAASAQDGEGGQRSVDGSRAPTDEPLPEPHMIPRPNEGHEPVDAGDRGGSLQLLLLGLMVVAVVGGTAYVVHESRRARAAREDRERRSVEAG